MKSKIIDVITLYKLQSPIQTLDSIFIWKSFMLKKHHFIMKERIQRWIIIIIQIYSNNLGHEIDHRYDTEHTALAAHTWWASSWAMILVTSFLSTTEEVSLSYRSVSSRKVSKPQFSIAPASKSGIATKSGHNRKKEITFSSSKALPGEIKICYPWFYCCGSRGSAFIWRS